MLRREVLGLSKLCRAYSSAPKGGPAPSSSTSTNASANVSGLSSNCVKPYKAPLGPGAKPDGEYKVVEYFSYNAYSYAEADVEMAKYRLPQPSAINPPPQQQK